MRDQKRIVHPRDSAGRRNGILLKYQALAVLLRKRGLELPQVSDRDERIFDRIAFLLLAALAGQVAVWPQEQELDVDLSLDYGIAEGLRGLLPSLLVPPIAVICCT